MFRTRYLPGFISPWLRIRLAMGRVSVPILLSLFSLLIAAAGFYFSNLRRTWAMSFSLLNLAESYDENTDIYKIDASLVAANYGNTTVLIGAVALNELVSPPPLLMAGHDTRPPDEPLFVASGVPQVLKPGDVGVVPLHFEFQKPTRDWIVNVEKGFASDLPSSLPVSVWLDTTVITSGGAQHWLAHPLFTLNATTLVRSKEVPVPPFEFAGTPFFAFADVCHHIVNVFASRTCDDSAVMISPLKE
jgi:hypothetical protein